MEARPSAVITATGMYVPPRVVTNEELATLMNTTDEWIQQRSGIRQRRWVAEDQAPADLALEAARQALEMAGLEPNDLELLLVATLSPDAFFPGTACFLHAKLGLRTQPAMDVRCQCSGFIYALETAKLFIESGQYRRLMVVGAEIHSKALDLTDEGRNTAVLFGDGAGAVILEARGHEGNGNGAGILRTRLHAEGEHARKLWVQSPGLANDRAVTAAHVEAKMCVPKMDGKFVFKNAVVRMPEVLRECLDANQVSFEDVDLFLFHQANLRINEVVAGSLGIPPAKTYDNITQYGNCSAASIPMLLDECVRSGRVQAGDLISMTSFGSGFTWASTLVRWV